MKYFEHDLLSTCPHLLTLPHFPTCPGLKTISCQITSLFYVFIKKYVRYINSTLIVPGLVWNVLNKVNGLYGLTSISTLMLYFQKDTNSRLPEL